MNERSFIKGDKLMDETSTKGERTRQEIMQSAHQLFLKNGYHGTSMREIAQGAGIAVGGIYNHFGCKEDIFMAVLSARHPIYDILPSLNSDVNQDIEGFVRDSARKMVEIVKGRPDFLNLMFIELVEFNAEHMPQMFQAFFPQALAFAQRIFSNRPQLRPIPIPILLRAYLGLFFSYVITDILMKNMMPGDMEKITLDTFIDIFLHGILAQGQLP
jgi:AcrR family transcriptional regulator